MEFFRKYYLLIVSLMCGFNSWGMTQIEALYEAAKEGDLNARDEYGSTALHAAAKCGKLEMAQCLIKWGADIEVNEVKERQQDEAVADEEEMDTNNILGLLESSKLSILPTAEEMVCGFVGLIGGVSYLIMWYHQRGEDGLAVEAL